MPWVIGVDEAGFGPNYGPLLITATLWRTPETDSGWPDEDYLGQADHEASPKIEIADSKVLYQPGKGLSRLETGLLATAFLQTPQQWRDAWRLAPGVDAELERLPWYRDFGCPLPIDAKVPQIDSARRDFLNICAASSRRLEVVRSRALFAETFNQQVERWGNKAAVLTAVSLDLVRELLRELPEGESAWVHCDKHGGRKRYQAPLQQWFPDRMVAVAEETQRRSRYQFAFRGAVHHIRFVAGGDAFTPAALASMASKYLRELAMRAFNAFWMREVPGLRPTAGYPTDARRFRADIEPARRRLREPLDRLWRNR